MNSVEFYHYPSSLVLIFSLSSLRVSKKLYSVIIFTGSLTIILYVGSLITLLIININSSRSVFVNHTHYGSKMTARLTQSLCCKLVCSSDVIDSTSKVKWKKSSSISVTLLYYNTCNKCQMYFLQNIYKIMKWKDCITVQEYELFLDSSHKFV